MSNTRTYIDHASYYYHVDFNNGKKAMVEIQEDERKSLRVEQVWHTHIGMSLSEKETKKAEHEALTLHTTRMKLS